MQAEEEEQMAGGDVAHNDWVELADSLALLELVEWNGYPSDLDIAGSVVHTHMNQATNNGVKTHTVSSTLKHVKCACITVYLLLGAGVPVKDSDAELVLCVRKLE